MRGAYAEEDTVLEFPEANLLHRITRRVLWCIAQIKYDLLDSQVLT
jgi:hypothetical protein